MRIIKKIFVWLIVLLVAFIGGFILNSFVGNEFVFELQPQYLFDKNTYLYTFFFFATISVIYAYNWNKSYWSRNSKNLMQSEKVIAYIGWTRTSTFSIRKRTFNKLYSNRV